MNPAAHRWAAMRRATPARLGVGRAGSRYTTAAWLKLRADHARAIDAVMTAVSRRWVERAGLIEVASLAGSRRDYILRPELGRRLAATDVTRLSRLRRRGVFRRAARTVSVKPSVLICVGDGLSSAAVEANAAPLLRDLLARLRPRYLMIPPLFVRNARVRIEDQLGEILRPDVVCMLIGERPGLATAESLSAYVIYRPRLSSLEPDRTVISNIHRGGLQVGAAARQITRLVDDAVRLEASGARLAHLIAARPEKD